MHCVKKASAWRSDTLALPMSMESGSSVRRSRVRVAGRPIVSSSCLALEWHTLIEMRVWLTELGPQGCPRLKIAKGLGD